MIENIQDNNLKLMTQYRKKDYEKSIRNWVNIIEFTHRKYEQKSAESHKN